MTNGKSFLAMLIRHRVLFILACKWEEENIKIKKFQMENNEIISKLLDGEDVYNCKKCNCITVHETVESTIINLKVKCKKCGTEKEIENESQGWGLLN